MRQDAVQPAGMRRPEEQAARLAVDLAEALAAQTHGGRVDDWHHLGEVAGQQGVEQRLVGVLQVAQEAVAAEIVARRAEGGEAAADLVVQARHMRRQEAVEVERVALGGGERHALVQDRVGQQLVARPVGRHSVAHAWPLLLPSQRRVVSEMMHPHARVEETSG